VQAGGADGPAEPAEATEVSDELDLGTLGSLMVQQLGTLLDSWTDALEVVVRHGVDPTPVLQTLARTLRATADQLDTPGQPA
jgi:hypothetical protein